MARNKVCEELQLLAIKPDTVYRHLKALADVNLIDYRKQGLKDCIRITKLGKSYVGNESEQTRKQIRTDSEMNPIYPTTRHPTTNISNNKNEQIDNFVPNQASIDRIKKTKGCESLNASEMALLVEDFKDRMRERKSSWKDIQSQFRTYVSKGWVTPNKVSKGKVDSKTTVEKQLLAMKINDLKGS